MCLAIPSKVIAIDAQTHSVTVETMGVIRHASLDLMEDNSVVLGDYVLIHIGFVMQTLDKAYAQVQLRTYEELLKELNS